MGRGKRAKRSESLKSCINNNIKKRMNFQSKDNSSQRNTFSPMISIQEIKDMLINLKGLMEKA